MTHRADLAKSIRSQTDALAYTLEDVPLAAPWVSWAHQWYDDQSERRASTAATAVLLIAGVLPQENSLIEACADATRAVELYETADATGDDHWLVGAAVRLERSRAALAMWRRARVAR